MSDVTPESKSFIGKLRANRNKGDSWLTRDLGSLFSAGARKADALDELETRLLMADAGVDATTWLTTHLGHEINAGRIKNEAQLRAAL